MGNSGKRSFEFGAADDSLPASKKMAFSAGANGPRARSVLTLYEATTASSQNVRAFEGAQRALDDRVS